MYLQSPRLDTIVNVLHLSPSSSENTKTVFLLLHLVSVASFVKFMSTTQLFFFHHSFSGATTWYVQSTGMDVKATKSGNKFLKRAKIEIIYTTKISEK